VVWSKESPPRTSLKAVPPFDNRGEYICGVENPVQKSRGYGFAEQLNPWFRSSDSKSPNDIYVGTVVLPGGEMRRRAFVKVFPPAVRGQLVYNEVIAHHLAVQCALPSPFTFPCACHSSLLKISTRNTMAPDPDSPFILGVASLDGADKSIKQTGGSFATKWADLMNWPHVANAAVFDELMGNDDRHIANLIRSAAHEYVLIDNERMLFGESWFQRDIKEFSARKCDANVLADTIAEGSDTVMRQRMIHLAQRYVMNTILTAPDVGKSLEHQCGAPRGTTDRLIDILNQRRTLLPSLMQWHLRKGDLFYASSNR
jgi:hypothetical protein